MPSPDALIDDEVRQAAARHWDWRGLFLVGAECEPGELPVYAFVVIAFSVVAYPALWLWRRFVGTPRTRDQAFVAFHEAQMALLVNVYVGMGFLTCCIGFPVLLLPALLTLRAGRRGALRGEWWRIPLFGWVVRKPADLLGCRT